MAASTKIISLENLNAADGWTVVLPRRGKKNRKPQKFSIPKQPKEQQPWAPTDVEMDTERESALLRKMQVSIQKLESTRFCRSFFDQLESSSVFERFLKVLGSEEKMQMVIYGIGSIESYETPRLQLSLAILIMRKFEWVGEVEVFDPVISLTECKVLTSLGCRVLSVNEQGRRKALKPTMFFMPHCEAELYENLLEANWGVDRLINLSLFGNSFDMQEEYVSICRNPTMARSRKHILAAARSFSEEFKVGEALSGSLTQSIPQSCEGKIRRTQQLEHGVLESVATQKPPLTLREIAIIRVLSDIRTQGDCTNTPCSYH